MENKKIALVLYLAVILLGVVVSAQGERVTIEINRNVIVTSASVHSTGPVNIAGVDFDSGVIDFKDAINNYLENQTSLIVSVPFTSNQSIRLSNLSIKQVIKNITLNGSIDFIDLGLFYNNYSLFFNHTPVNGIEVTINSGVVSLKNINATGRQDIVFSASDGTYTIYTNNISIGIEGTLDVVPRIVGKKVYGLDEKPDFEFEFYSDEDAIEFDLESGLNESNISDNLLVSDEETIRTFLYQEDEPLDEKIKIKERRKGKYEIEVESKREFRAGKYKLIVQLEKEGRVYLEEYEFSWGVLAINTHKATYLENENAFIGIAVLDDFGRMVCDADVTLDIIDPLGSVTTLTTSNGDILVSGECEFYGVTDLPDYYTNYDVEGEGVYLMNLTAVTENGVESLEDNFSVVSDIDYDVRRLGPTRIYPLVPYTMNFSIGINKNYNGEIYEYVPSSFAITPQSGLSVSQVGNAKELAWDVKAKKGDVLDIYYEFDAPDISPFLFTLGKLQIGGFEEGRNWLIASDAVTSYRSPNQTGVPLNQWANGYRVQLSDNLKATETLDTEKVDTSNYSLGVPDSATSIDGIEVSLEANCQGRNCGTADMDVDLSYDGGTTYTSAKGNAFTSAESTVTLGNSTDTWGRTWNWSELTNVTFRARLTKAGGAGTAAVDHIQVRVYYTSPSNPPEIVNPLINESSSVGLNHIVKVNATVTDSDANLDTVIIQVDPPNTAAYNITTGNSGDEYFNDTITLDEYGQWVFTFNADDETGLNATAAIANDSLGNAYIHVADIPSTTLNGPPNTSVHDVVPLNVTLNATVINNDGEMMEVLFYVANSTDTGNFHSFLVYKEEGVSNTSAVTYNFTALPISNNSQDLRALIHFDNNTNYDNETKAYDWSINGNHYDFVNGPFYNNSEGKFGYSLDLDGNDQFAFRASDNGIGAYPFAFSAWVLYDGSENGTIVELLRDLVENGEDLFGIGVNEVGNPHIYACTNTGLGQACLIQDVVYATSSTTLSTSWHHIAGVFESATERRLYVDGRNVINGTDSFDFDTQTNRIVIGSGGHNQVANFSGLIDEVGIWNRSLTTDEVKNMYKANLDKYYWKVNVTNGGGMNNESVEREFNVSVVDTSVRGCKTLNLTGETYTLENNVSSKNNCIVIGAHNVTLKGQGNLINYSQVSVGYAIDNTAGYDNATIRDLVITQGNISATLSNAIYFDSAKNGTVKDVNITTYALSSFGVRFSTVNDSVITNVTIVTNGTTGYGIQLDSGSNRNSISEVNISAYVAASIGTYFLSSNDNSFTRSTIFTSTIISPGIRIESADRNQISHINITTNETDSEGILIVLSAGNLFSNVSLNVSRENAIHLSGAISDNNTFENVSIFGTNKTVLHIKFANEGIDKTKFINMPYIENYTFDESGGTIMIEDTTFGEIEFLEAVNGSGGNFSNEIRIGNNSVTVESASNNELNVSANITLYGTPGVGIDNPEILKDGASCGDACYNFTQLDVATVIFNVSSWSNYSIGDKTPPTITINSIGEDTVSAYSTSDNTPTANITTTEAADCFASLDGDESYDDMSDDINCTGDTTTNHICEFTSEISDTLSQGVAFACRDNSENKNDASNNNDVTIEVDTVIPNQSDWIPANLSVVTTTSPTITFNITENGDCKWSLTDQSYDAMVGDCTGDGTQDMTCATTGLTEGSDIVYLACSDDTDAFPNNDSITTNWLVNYTIDSIPPNVTINFPDVADYNSSDLPFNFNVSLSENGSVTYSLDRGATNITMTSTDEDSAFGFLFNGTNGSIADGEYNFSVYANDSYGNNNFSEYANFSLDTSGAISISLSNALASQINWTVAGSNVKNQSAEGNNDNETTDYFVNISVEGGGTADLFIRANSDLYTPDGDLIGLGNETLSYNSSNNSVPSTFGYSLTTNYNDTKIGNALPTGSVVYLKFFLSVPLAQPAGSYNNTLEFKAVPTGVEP